MPYADPERERAYQAAWWASHPGYRARNPETVLPPIRRQSVLDEDVAQARVLAELEGRRIGRQRAQQRLDDWIAAERRWIRLTSSQYVIEGEPEHDR